MKGTVMLYTVEKVTTSFDICTVDEGYIMLYTVEIVTTSFSTCTVDEGYSYAVHCTDSYNQLQYMYSR